jgi:hypothetical protein
MWPWRHQRGESGHAATQAREGATEQLRRAERATPKVDRTAWLAGELARRAGLFTAEIERALHLRRS